MQITSVYDNAYYTHKTVNKSYKIKITKIL
jgi:hypothetical protein